MDIKGLKEKVGLTPEQEKTFDRMRIQAALLIATIWRTGGNFHGVNIKETRKRRARNKLARKQRRIARVRSGH